MTTTPRTRKSHNKVRTGCSTCKARRKKCDEARPSCRRCTVAKFRCDGYAEIVAPRVGIVNAEGRSELLPASLSPSKLSATSSNHSAQSTHWDSASVPNDSNAGTYLSSIPTRFHTPRKSVIDLFAWAEGKIQEHSGSCDAAPLREVSPALTRHPNALAELSTISDLEVHCYSFFRHNTVPRLATYFEHCIWRIDLQNAALVVRHPTLFKAVTALGAVHRRFCYGISREAFQYCAHAARLYSHAVDSLDKFRQSLGESITDSDKSIITTCEALFSLYQGFQSDDNASERHIRAAVRGFINRPQRLLHSESWYCASPSPPRIICNMMYQLYCRATELYGEPALLHTPNYDIPVPELQIPIEFQSMKEMKSYIYGIAEQFWRGYRFVENVSDRYDHLKIYENYLHQWTTACLKTLAAANVVIDVQAFNILNLMHSALCVSIRSNMFPISTNRRDLRPIPCLPVFKAPDDRRDLSEAAIECRRAVELMYTINDADMSLVRSIIRDALSTRKIFEFSQQELFESKALAKSPDLHVNEMINLWTIAQRVSKMEEDAVVEACVDVIPPKATFVDIADVWRDERKIALRYFEPNHNGDGCRWVQEFWTY